MKIDTNQKVAWLLPTMGTGGISFQHLLNEFTKKFPNTLVFTGQWPGFASGFENSFSVQEVGTSKYIQLGKTSNGYKVGFFYVSPKIINRLLSFKPQFIFVNAFSAWTVIALILKPIGRWKVAIVYEGSSSSVDYQGSRLRLNMRCLMVSSADAFIANGQGAEDYLVRVLKARSERVFSRPVFLVPSIKALMHGVKKFQPEVSNLYSKQRPIFLYVGQIISRKGVDTLLEACVLLNQRGIERYSLLIVGSGEQKSQLEKFVINNQLNKQIFWVGKVQYDCLGFYYNLADIFVFPTKEDVWGMVLPEAMAFGKPVICSKGAGSVEMVEDRENGFIFEPKNATQLACIMQHLIEHPNLIKDLGEKSREIMKQNTPKNAIQSFISAIKFMESS